MKTIIPVLLAVCLLAGALVATPALAGDSSLIRVTFLTPSPTTRYPFWDDYVSFMKVAATSLGIDLTVLEAKGRFEVVDNARAVLESASKPDYLMYIYQAENTRDVLNMAEKAGGRSIITNTDVYPKERLFAGFPRQRYDHWIGHILPDDAMAGTVLAERLVKAWRQQKQLGPDDIVRVMGLGGNLDATASVYREKGLRSFIERRPNVVLDRYVLCDWDKEVAFEKSVRLMEIYPRTGVYWAANDHIAAGVLMAAEAQGLRPGEDIITGGMDWSAQGIEAVRAGRMEVTLGGHFMEGAWALIMAYDYHHGNDFADFGLVQHSQMRAIDATNIETYLSLLDRANWEKIDFKAFTRTDNPGLEEYDFSPDAVLRVLGCRP